MARVSSAGVAEAKGRAKSGDGTFVPFSNFDAVVEEVLRAKYSERAGRLIDHDQAASMEKKKQEGYF